MTNSWAVAEAYEWVGTRFHDQASVKGHACDCKGLVWGIARERRRIEAQSFHANIIDYDLKKPIDWKLLKAGMAEVFDRVEDPEPGDVLLLKVHGKPGHLAIYCGERNGLGRVIHAQIAPTDRVKETTMRSLLKLNPLDSVWRWRDGD